MRSPKIEKDAEIVWADIEEACVCHGASQPFGIDKHVFRLIAEDKDGAPLNAPWRS